MYRFLSRPRSKENNGPSHYFTLLSIKNQCNPNGCTHLRDSVIWQLFLLLSSALKERFMLCLPFEESFHLRSYLSLTFSFLFFFFLHLHILFSNVFSRAVEKFNKKTLRRKVAHVQFSLYQMLNPPKYTVNGTLLEVASLSFLTALI